jgi:hypothetical protein
MPFSASMNANLTGGIAIVGGLCVARVTEVNSECVVECWRREENGSHHKSRLMNSQGAPPNRLQRTALRAAAEPGRSEEHGRERNS